MSTRQLERILETEADEMKVEKAISAFLKGASHDEKQ